jgi:predicted MFS family arabinose efflux permease
MQNLILNGLKNWLESFKGLSKEIWILSLITLVNRSGTVVIIFLSIYLTGQLGFSKSQAGIVIGCFGVGSLLGAWTGGLLTDKIGYYKVMFLSMFAVGFFFFGMAYVKEFYAFCAIVIATAAVGDMYGPASSASIAAYSKKENNSRALSLIRLAINLGFAVGSSAVGFIAGAYGYYWLFMIDGTTCILAAFLFIFIMKNKPEIIEKEEEEATSSNNEKIRSPYTDAWFLAFMFCLALCSIPFFQLFTAYPVFLMEELLFSEFEFGAIMAFNGLLLFLCEMPIVHTLTKRNEEMPSVAIGAFLIAISFFVFNIFGFYTWVAIVAMVLIVFGEILNFPFSTAVALSRSHTSNRGRYMGVFSMTFSFCFIFSPWMGMKIIELYNYETLWCTMGILSIISTLGLFYLGKSYKPIFSHDKHTRPMNFSYSDGNGNRYEIKDNRIEYIPVEPAFSSSGSYSGGDPLKKEITDVQAHQLDALVQLAFDKTTAHIERRKKGSGLVHMNKKTVILAMSAAAKQDLEKELKDVINS